MRNEGEAAALLVQLSGVSASATAVQSGTLPAAQTIPCNGSAVFHIAFTAQSEGTFTLTAGAMGTEANAGTAISAAIPFHAGMAIGKFHGVMRPATPSGMRTDMLNLFGSSDGVV